MMKVKKRNALVFDQQMLVQHTVYLKTELTEEQEEEIECFIKETQPTNFDDINIFVYELIGEKNIISTDTVENPHDEEEIEFTDVYFEESVLNKKETQNDK